MLHHALHSPGWIPRYYMTHPIYRCARPWTSLAIWRPEWCRQSTETARPWWDASPARDWHKGVDDLALRRLRSSMTLQRASQSCPVSCRWRFWVIRCLALLSARWRLPLAEDATSLWARLTQSMDWLPTESSLQGLPTDFSATTRFAASAPYCASATRGELSGVMR
jgi:hypothetical protein